MSKNIVICSDGTGNSASREQGTNVYRIYDAVDTCGYLTNANKPKQITIYDDGVGTESVKPIRMLAQAIGFGLGHNVRQLYAELTWVYEPGDRIYLFGFSRGAFTVRSLAGLITRIGILDCHQPSCENQIILRRRVRKTYQNYRRIFPTYLSRLYEKKFEDTDITQYREEFCVADSENAVEFIGVWDTVDALGLPSDILADFINDTFYRFKFSDRKLSKRVKKGCQALAIDDERRTFHPVMWEEDKDDECRIKQVWFTGAHSNVGGGYPRQGTALVTLDWMMREAEQSGLHFLPHDRDDYREHQNIHDKVYEPRTGIGMYYQYQPRDIETITREQVCCASAEAVPEKSVKPKLHWSVMERIAMGTDGYAPGNLPRDFHIIASNGEPVEAPELTKTLEHHLGTHANLLTKVAKNIRYRTYIHKGFFLSTLVTLFFTYDGAQSANRSSIDTFSNLFTLSGLLDVVNTLLHNQNLLFVLGLFAFGSWALKRHVHKEFSKFWQSARLDFRHQLKILERSLKN